MARTLPDHVGLLPLGTKRLRDVGSIRLYQVVHPQLQQEFPELRGVLGYRTNLPHSPTPYVGGDQLLASIADPKARRFAEINYGPWDRLAHSMPQPVPFNRAKKKK